MTDIGLSLRTPPLFHVLGEGTAISDRVVEKDTLPVKLIPDKAPLVTVKGLRVDIDALTFIHSVLDTTRVGDPTCVGIITVTSDFAELKVTLVNCAIALLVRALSVELVIGPRPRIDFLLCVYVFALP